MKLIKQVTRGPFRINIEVPEDDRNVYYQIEFAAKSDGSATRWSTLSASEIVFVRNSRIAFNNAIQNYGAALLAIRNLETGELVVGAKS